MNWNPHPYQIRGVNFLLEHRAAALFLDPGMGKTSITLRALLEAKRAGCRKTLVVAPLRVIYDSWPGEAAKWDDFKSLRVENYHKRNPKEMIVSDADIILVNYDYLRKMFADCPKKQTLAEFYQLGGLVIDELTAFKSTKSARFRGLRPHLPGFLFRWGLTGTPVINRLEDVFGQVYVLDMGETFGRFVTHFRNEYFTPVGYGGYKLRIQSPAKQDELLAKLGKISMSMRAEDYLDMPPFIENRLSVELPPPAMRTYKEMERDFITWLKDETITAAGKAVALNKCRQMASGCVYDGGHASHDIHQAKLDALRELVEELNGNPLLVFVAFEHEVLRLKEAFPEAECIYGGVSAQKAQDVVAKWAFGEMPLLIAHPMTAGRGLNLQGGGHHLCWYTLPWDAEVYDQANRRLYRQGQDKPVMCHHIMARGTVDNYVKRLLQDKRRTQDEVFEYLKGEML